MTLPSDHGVILLSKMLDDLDGRQVTVNVEGRGVRAAHGGVVVGPTRRDIEEIAAEVYDRKTDYQQRRR